MKVLKLKEEERKSLRKEIEDLNNKIDRLQEENLSLQLENKIDHSMQSKENQLILEEIKKQKRYNYIKLGLVAVFLVFIIYTGTQINITDLLRILL